MEVDPWVIIDKLRMQHSDEIKDVWMPLVAQWRDNCEQLQSRLELLENALSTANEKVEHFEREWYLRGDVIESLEKENASLKQDVVQLKLRLETIRALFPSAPSDEELDIAINAAMQSANKEK